MADDWMASQIKVANGVQGFVTDELILVAQAIVIQDAVAVDDDRIVQSAAAGQAGFAQGGDIGQKTEGASLTELGFENFPPNRE